MRWISNQQSLDDLLTHPLTASIFAYLRQENRPVGVREVQRALNLSNPSTAYWHLNKLHHHEVLTQVPGNKYQIAEAYTKIRKVPLTVVLDYYFLGGKMVPNLVVVILFLIIDSFAVFILISFGWWPAAALTGLFTLTIATWLVIKLYIQLTKPLMQNE